MIFCLDFIETVRDCLNFDMPDSFKLAGQTKCVKNE